MSGHRCLSCGRWHVQNERPKLITLPSKREAWMCCECAGDMWAEQDAERQLDAKAKVST